MIQQGEYPEALCKLEFVDVMYTQAWLDDFMWHLVKLTSLTLCSHNSCITGRKLEALSSKYDSCLEDLIRLCWLETPDMVCQGRPYRLLEPYWYNARMPTQSIQDIEQLYVNDHTIV